MIGFTLIDRIVAVDNGTVNLVNYFAFRRQNQSIFIALMMMMMMMTIMVMPETSSAYNKLVIQLGLMGDGQMEYTICRTYI